MNKHAWLLKFKVPDYLKNTLKSKVLNAPFKIQNRLHSVYYTIYEVLSSNCDFFSLLFQTPGVGKAANVLVGKALGTNGTSPSNQTLGSVCHPAQTTEAVVLFTIAALGMGANMFLMLLIVFKRPLRRYNPKIIEIQKTFLSLKNVRT